MGLSFSSFLRQREETGKKESRFFISLSGPEVPKDPQVSIPQTIRQAELLQHSSNSCRRTNGFLPNLSIFLPRQEHVQRVDPVTIDLLANLLVESSMLLELDLYCFGKVPDSLCQAMARNQTIRNLHLTFANFEELLHADLMDSIGRNNNTIESLCIKGDMNKMAGSVARLLQLLEEPLRPGQRLLHLKLIHTARIHDFKRHVKYGAIDAKQMEMIIRAVGSSLDLKKFCFRSNGGAVHYSNLHLATLLQSPSLESIFLGEIKLCGEESSLSSNDGHRVYAALSSNLQLRELLLWSFTFFVQDRDIAANLEREMEAALNDSNATLVKLDTFNTIRITECMQYWLDLNGHGRALIRNEEKLVDKLLPHILARVSNNPNRLYGLLREAAECVSAHDRNRKSDSNLER